MTISLVVFIVFCECKKHDVDKLQNDYKHLKVDSKDIGVGHYTHHKKHRLRGAHLDLSEGGSSSLHDDWMKIPKESECKKTKCGHKEFCLANSKTGEEKCVSKKNFKESRRLFRDFHKQKEMLKKDMTQDVMDKDLVKAEQMKDVYDLINDYNKMEDHHHKKHIEEKAALEIEPMKLPTEATEGTVQECRPTELYELRKRMVGWFVLMHTESRRDHHHHKDEKQHKKHGTKFDRTFDKDFGFGSKKTDLEVDMKKKDMKTHHLTKRAAEETVDTESHHQCKCSKSAMWEFRKQDANRDSILSPKEMEAFSANRREPCMAALLKSCDTDSDGAVTHGEWCCCMAYTIPPCLEKKRLTDPKDWVPRCDKEGYYEREQCHDNTGYCWCVDINGNEIVGTKKIGSAHCGRYHANGHLDKHTME